MSHRRLLARLTVGHLLPRTLIVMNQNLVLLNIVKDVISFL